MSKTTCLRAIALTFTVLLFTSTVKARSLGLESHPISSSMISDGINHHPESTTGGDYLRMVDGGSDSSASKTRTMLKDENRCASMLGFLPCANTIGEGVFLIITYTYLMMLGEEYIMKGGVALFILMGDKGKIGASVFRVVMAMPRIALVIAGGLLSTEAAAKYQVAFGVSMYAGSTLITLTFIWGFFIILCKDKLRGKEELGQYQHQEDSSTKCLPLKQKLSFLNDNGVNIDRETGDIALIMLLSLIPFAVVQLATLVKSPTTILVSLIISGVSLALYFGYQIGHPWIQVRSLAFLRGENLRNRFFFHVQKLSQHNLIDEQGGPIIDAFRRIFYMADKDADLFISREELKSLIADKLKLENDLICMEYAKAEILTHFDEDNDGMISLPEFEKGCTKWLKKWKNDANNSNFVTKNIWNYAIRNKQKDLTQIEKIMPRILKQLFEKYDLVKDGEPDKEKIESLFVENDDNKDGKVGTDELIEFIKNLKFGISLDPDEILKEIIKDFDNDNNSSIEKSEFVDGFVKWIKKAINHDPTIKDPKQAIAKFEADSWAEIDAHFSMARKPNKANILYLILGLLIMLTISGAFMQSVLQFSNAAQIPFALTSFVVFPIALYSRMIIKVLLNPQLRVSKNASLTFSEIYNGLVMNNLLGLFTLLILVYMKGLPWIYSKEVLTMTIPCAVVGLFALNRDTYPLWASICAMVLYPIYVFLFYVLTL